MGGSGLDQTDDFQKFCGSGLDRTDGFQKFCGSGLDRIQFLWIRIGLGLKNFRVRSSLIFTHRLVIFVCKDSLTCTKLMLLP